ncbi:MAG TPA: hypothetical protein VN894_17415 [Polyangiaceae bacterium]|nr:hypothetical protein [Polyangiaceae bacterium]
MTDDSVRETMTTSDGSRAAAATPPAAPPPGAASVDLTDAHPRTGRLLARWTHPETSARRLLIAAIVYVVCTGVFATIAGPDRLFRHTPFNHYALLANAWLHGHQDLPGGPPAYTQNNDFAEYRGKTYISFPPFPAALMLPFVKLAGSAEDFRDGQFVIWLAGLAPAILFLALEKLRRTARSPRTELENIVLSLLFAFGSVYFFTAVEGTVWFAALVIGAALQALYVLFALDAERPLLAGAMLGCAYLTRATPLAAAPLFALEALRMSVRGGLPSEGPWGARIKDSLSHLDVRALGRRYALFAAPVLAAFAIVAWMNWTRYGRATPIYFDHELLTVAWRGRMAKWGGVMSYHFLAKNLGIALTSLPWLPARSEAAQFGAPFKINEHGLALWFTTPLYFWLLWPKRFDGERDRKWLYVIVTLSAAVPVAMDLLYQNSGWRQFGYRFSNDYAILLFVLLAIGARPMRYLFGVAAAWSVAWNLFGAATFDKAAFDRFYFRDGSQTIVYQPD